MQSVFVNLYCLLKLLMLSCHPLELVWWKIVARLSIGGLGYDHLVSCSTHKDKIVWMNGNRGAGGCPLPHWHTVECFWSWLGWVGPFCKLFTSEKQIFLRRKKWSAKISCYLDYYNWFPRLLNITVCLSNNPFCFIVI